LRGYPFYPKLTEEKLRKYIEEHEEEIRAQARRIA
jgi:hypothetical protein|tara:strand:- start:34700 stop:34804 length:105 start_codon:yes stop_codon:yes gene_type:complete